MDSLQKLLLMSVTTLPDNLYPMWKEYNVVITPKRSFLNETCPFEKKRARGFWTTTRVYPRIPEISRLISPSIQILWMPNGEYPDY